MKEILFSIIVPVYNVEKYLAECLESILFQSYQNYEVICIDDASTDNSYKILCDIAKECGKIKILNNEVNEGPSYSRNRGIEAAQGNYILFVDSDDYIAKDALEVLANILRENSVDFLNFNFELKKESVYEKERNLSIAKILGKDNSLKSGQRWFMDALFENSIIVMTWGRVYRKDFLKENSLCFYNQLVHEDILFLLQAAVKAKKVMSIDNCLYVYRKREGSITAVKNEIRLDSLVVIINEMLELIRKDTLEEGMETAIYQYLSKYWIPLIRTLIMSFPSHKEMEIGGPDAQFLFSVFRVLCGGQSFRHIDFTREELKIIQDSDRRIIYGAGNICSELLQYLQYNNIPVHAIAVTNKGINTKEIAGYKIHQIDELIEYRKEALVMVAVSKRNQETVRKKLADLGFHNILLV